MARLPALLLVALLTLTCACAPDDTTEPTGDTGGADSGSADTGGTDTGGTDGGDTGGGDTGGDTGPAVAFTQVADIMITNCALNFCHGDQGAQGNFQIPNGSSATAADVRTALDGVSTASTSSQADVLVDPGNPNGSEIYLRISSTEQGYMMPSTGQLTADQIETIRTWIAQGAPYE